MLRRRAPRRSRDNAIPRLADANTPADAPATVRALFPAVAYARARSTVVPASPADRRYSPRHPAAAKVAASAGDVRPGPDCAPREKSSLADCPAAPVNPNADTGA